MKALEKRRPGVHQLLDLTKTLKKNATQTAPNRCSQPGPAQAGVARNEASCKRSQAKLAAGKERAPERREYKATR